MWVDEGEERQGSRWVRGNGWAEEICLAGRVVVRWRCVMSSDILWRWWDRRCIVGIQDKRWHLEHEQRDSWRGGMISEWETADRHQSELVVWWKLWNGGLECVDGKVAGRQRVYGQVQFDGTACMEEERAGGAIERRRFASSNLTAEICGQHWKREGVQGWLRSLSLEAFKFVCSPLGELFNATDAYSLRGGIYNLYILLRAVTWRRLSFSLFRRPRSWRPWLTVAVKWTKTGLSLLGWTPRQKNVNLVFILINTRKKTAERFLRSKGCIENWNMPNQCTTLQIILFFLR